ncbi:hypothetical protein Goklo_029469, partial [Gossypium klotzschianum]|nr:hypothetical protein [Gossypium klotzschianum]
MTSQRKSGWPFFKICKKRTLSGELRGSIGQGSLYLQLGDYLSVNSHIRVMVAKRRFERYPMRRN